MNTPHSKTKELSKQLEFVKQQEQLRALTTGSASTSKALSADSMIENLLSKKETFQKRNPEVQQMQVQELPTWLVSSVPPLYERVWAGVQAAGGGALADTPLLSTLLMSSGLSTDTLGYIWSLANRTVPGSLTQPELYLVLALVALAQTGYVVSNLAAVYQLPQAPLPTLDLTLLPPRVATSSIYPSPLSVTNLPADPLTFNWASQPSSEPNYQSFSDKIGISYVSSGPMISPKLLSEPKPALASSNPQVPQVSNLNITEFNINDNAPSHRNTFKSVPTSSKTTSHSKHSSNTYSFSFPSLNESPSHLAKLKTEDQDCFDDEFTDFQSADFTSVSQKGESYSTSMLDDDEFTNFQKASPAGGDDLSVLVVSGNSIPSAQQLWVEDSPSIHTKQKKFSTLEFGMSQTSENKTEDLCTNDMMFETLSTTNEKDEKQITSQSKYDALQELSDNKFSVFHNPLPEDEDKQSVFSKGIAESDFSVTTSIFKHSLFDNPEPSVTSFKSEHQTPSLELPKPFPNFQNNIVDDDEFSNFQNFPVSFTTNDDSSSTVSSNNKYDVFRTIVFQDSSAQKVEEAKKLNDGPDLIAQNSNNQTFDCEMDTFTEFKSGNSSVFEETVHMKFGDSKESELPPNATPTIDNLFSSLAISDKVSKKDTNESNDSLSLAASEDKYKALRLLETSTGESDEFGDFSGAEFPSSGNFPQKNIEESSIQIRCLEACLNLLKDGFTTLSKASTPEVVSEVLNDPRGNTYLDCLLEVHRVSERILSHMESSSVGSIKDELHQVWENLTTFYSHMEHNHLTETIGAVCGICKSDTGPSPVTFGGLSFHAPCANLYLHCVEPVLPNLATPTSTVQSH